MIVLLASAIPALGMTGPAAAQTGITPATPYYAMPQAAPSNPTLQSPLQQQELLNYRSQLQATQRDMLQQNPSGLGREQLAIGHQLNALDLPANPPAALSSGSSAPISALTPPFSAGGSVTAPPFNAAPPAAAGGLSR